MVEKTKTNELSRLGNKGDDKSDKKMNTSGPSCKQSGTDITSHFRPARAVVVATSLIIQKHHDGILMALSRLFNKFLRFYEYVGSGLLLSGTPS